MPAAAPVGKKRSKRNANHGGDSGSGAKKQKINKTKSKVVSTNEVEELSADVDTWDWSEVKTSNAKLTDDMTGFLCLEEIDDVQVEYEMDAARGKVAKFKRVKKANRKSGKKATPEEPLSLEEHKGFYHIDTFDEKLAAKGQIVDAENVSQDSADEEMNDVEQEEEVLIPVEYENEDLEEVSVHEDDDGEDLEEVSVDEEEQDEKSESEEEGEESASEDEKEQQQEQPKQEKETKVDAKKEKVTKLSKKEKKKQQEKEKAATEAKTKSPGSKPIVKLEDVDQNFDVSGWKDIQLAEPIVNALKYYKFGKPTPIQEKALPRAFSGKDIIGVAETGSGKTLAFGIPIVQHIINAEERPRGLTGLILAPTRELAIQVKDHIQNIAVFTDIKVAAVVGGMSPQKQQRVLKQKPDIIVATPGRLWEIFSEDDEYMAMLRGIKILVLDEADRMLEKGRFEELTNILNEISTKKKDTTNWPEELEANKPRKELRYKGSHQTFVFTATLNQDIQALRSKKKLKNRKRTAAGTMGDLLRRLELENKNPSIIDITTENRVASRLAEAKIECLKKEKDLYVYYFVTRYPGRTIIFVNSIDAIRRFVPIFKLLGVEVLSLHAQMQQRQRLKNLDRFKANEKAILVASDVAARGLDIPLVEHVIHYQLPRTSEIYVHRSGRTARANRDGISLLLSSPEEIKQYRSLRQSLRKGKDYPEFPVDMSLLNEMRKRVNLATDIDQLEHQEEKASHDVNWMRKMAKEADLDFDEDMLDTKKDDDDDAPAKKRKKAQVNAKKAELQALLSKPMLPMGVSGRYLTSSVVSDLVDRLLENEGKDTLLPTLATSRAVQEVKKR